MESMYLYDLHGWKAGCTVGEDKRITIAGITKKIKTKFSKNLGLG